MVSWVQKKNLATLIRLGFTFHKGARDGGEGSRCPRGPEGRVLFAH